MNDDWEYTDLYCPKCGEQMSRRECDVIGCDDGFIDEYDDDAINFAPSEEYRECSECRGQGSHEWCRDCGWDNTFQRFLQPKYEQEWLEKQAKKLA